MAKRAPATARRNRSKNFTGAVHAYEAGIKLMHSERYEKARKCFENLIQEYPSETEIHERARLLIAACEKKQQDGLRKTVRSAEDHYNVAVAELNRRELDSAIQHLQHALKLAPKADHILYALAAAKAIQGNRDQAITYLKESIRYRAENRFLAAHDSDFETLVEDADFKRLVTSAEA